MDPTSDIAPPAPPSRSMTCHIWWERTRSSRAGGFRSMRRFSPGDFPVLNATLQDRSGVFTAREDAVVEPGARVRRLGKNRYEHQRLRERHCSVPRPAPTAASGGARVQIGTRAGISPYAPKGNGGRVSRPILQVSPQGTTRVATTSDTGVVSAELQSTFGKLTTFGRYARRNNVDSSFASSTFTQDDTAGQFYLNLSQHTQLFGAATLTNQRATSGSASTFLQLTIGGTAGRPRGTLVASRRHGKPQPRFDDRPPDAA